jgi:chromosome segregation ATPase
MLNDYGSSTSRSRPTVKSPNPHLEDPRALRKKLDAARESLRSERKNAEALEGVVRGLRETTAKQERELSKKDEQIDILLEQIKYLKNVIAEGKSKKSSKEISKEASSYEEAIITKSTHSEEYTDKPPTVGGYFGQMFNSQAP